MIETNLVADEQEVQFLVETEGPCPSAWND